MHILYTFTIVSTKLLIANYASIDKLKLISQKFNMRGKLREYKGVSRKFSREGEWKKARKLAKKNNKK